MCFFVQTNHTRKELLFLMFKEINLRNHSSLHKLFYSLGFINKKLAIKLGIISTLILFLAFKLLESITNRYWFSLAFISSSYLIFLIANIIKIQLRDEPILPFDLLMTKELPNLLKMINPSYLIIAIILISLIILLTIWLTRHKPVQKMNSLNRILWITISVILFGSTSFWNHTNTIFPKINSAIGNDPSFWNQVWGAKNNGILLQFLNNIDVQIMPQPHNYSKTTIEKIIKKYQKLSIEINKNRKNDISKQTVIFNLSEAFSDPRRVPGIQLSSSPIPNVDKIKQNTTSGVMMSSGYGGGTANMEYMSLTGFAACNFSPTMSSPYTQLVPHESFIPTFNQDFPYSVGIHPYTGEFYNRIPNYHKFKFNKFYYLGNKKAPIKHLHKIGKNSYQSDKTAYSNLLDQLVRYTKPQFINLITMQNHYPYNKLYKKHNIKVKSKNGSNDKAISTFSTGLQYSDQEIKNTIEKINKLKRPITLVFYGDHLPVVGYANSMTKDGIKLHETDYFIYSNIAARKDEAKNLKKHIKYVSPSNFIAMTLKQTNSKVTPYQALLTQIYNKLPAFSVDSTGKSSNAQFINKNGKKTKLTKSQKKLWNEYLMIQYDLTAGNSYSHKSSFFYYKK